MAPDCFGQPIQHAAAQPGAERARRVVGVELVVDHRADRGVLAVELPAARRARLGDLLVLVALVARIDVDGDDREVDRRALPQHVEDLDQRPAVLAARQADHDPVAVFDQVEVGDRLGGLLLLRKT